MVFGLSGPIVSEACDTELFVKLNLLDAPCVKLAISKALGFAIIAGAAVVKVPQILKIVNSGSVAGLSLSAFLLELTGFTIAVAYNYQQKFPFGTWGELAFLAVQSVALVALMLVYSRKGFLFPFFVAGYGAFAYSLATGAVPPETLKTMQAATIPIFTVSKLPQIWANFRNGHTGQLSAITTFMNFAGTAARIFTTLTQVNDTLMLTSHLISTALNGIIALQMLAYWKKTNAVTSDKKKK